MALGCTAVGIGGQRSDTEGNAAPGALPDFVVIGAQKSGTTTLYDVLAKHPRVAPAVLRKEIHYFTMFFDRGAEWYRSCFPQPSWSEGRRTITGEATPYYLFHPDAARRAAQAIPQARLIVLLRNPVDRAYSHYQMVRTLGKEPLGFEEALEAEKKRLRGEEEKMLEDERYFSTVHQLHSYASRGLYMRQLRRWTSFFDPRQILVLRSEDFFGRPAETLGVVLDFLGLPAWEPDAWTISRKGEYDRAMNPTTRCYLKAYFDPHNRELYRYLGTDFGW